MRDELLSDIQIVQSCALGDPEAFAVIVRKYQSLVCAITYSAVGQVEKSEELAQQVFINAWKNLDQLKEPDRFKFWLVGITRNVIRTFYRQQKRDIVNNAASIDQIPDTPGRVAEPLDAIISKEQEALVQESLQQIPEKYREPLVLFYRQQQSTRQVAEALDLTEEAVRTRLLRGRKLLKDQVTQMVESTLSHTGPGKTFTAMVVASIAGLSLTGSSASAASTSAGSSGLTTLTTGVAAKLITVAAVVAVSAGVIFAYIHMSDTHAQHVLADVETMQTEELSVPSSESGDVAGAQSLHQGAAEQIESPELEHADVPAIDTADVDTDEAIDLEDEFAVGVETFGMGIYVFDEEEEEKGLAGADVKVGFGCSCNCEPKHFTTNADGFYAIDFGETKPDYLSILVSKPGYVPKMFAWRDAMLEHLEEEFAFFLPKGKPIGGVIKNERDEPIASAKVTVWMNDTESRQEPWMRISDVPFETDPNGRWVCDIYPEQPYSFSIKLSHPDYADTKEWINEREYRYDDFYQLTSTLVMKDGVLLSGTVVDKRGMPIKDATVFTGEDRFDEESPRVTTDGQGRFELPHFLPRWDGDKVVLTVQAKGYGPELQVIAMRQDMEPVRITLGKPHTIKIRVQDANGDPIVGAGIDVDDWREFRSLSKRGETDSEGRFVWDEAPADAINIDIDKANFLRVAEQEFIARDEEYTIVMLAPLVVSGTVVDAETKEPVPYFTAMKGIQWKGGRVSWESGLYNTEDFMDGHYEISFTQPYPGHVVRIDAEGYLPAKSRVFDSNEASVSFDFELYKGSGPGGFVYDPNGFPAEGAAVYVIMKGDHLSFENGTPSNEPDEDKWAQTDIDGAFSFKGLMDDSAYVLVVIHDSGFADISQAQWENDPNIYLQQWGRIEGTLYSGLRPEANQGVHFYATYTHNNAENMNYYFGVNVKTDEHGVFKMDRVIPLAGSVARRIRSENGRRYSYSNNTVVEVVSGETTHVDIGGGGRTVTGTLVKPTWATGVVDVDQVRPTVKTRESEMMNPYEVYGDMEFPMPDAFDEMTVAEVMQWLQEWLQSPEGQALQQEAEKRMEELGMNESRRYNCMVETDGRFTIVDMLPGEYILSGPLRKANSQGDPDYQAPVAAEIHHSFAVDDLTEENQDIPIELGVVEFLPPAGDLEPGQMVPGFTVYSADDDVITLGDYSGKYLLLTFYTTASESGAEEMENLKRIQDDFAGHPQFEMLGITVAGFPLLEKLAQKYLDEFGLTWQQGFIDSRNYEMMKTYKFEGSACTIFIAPDGTLIAAGLKGDALYDAVLSACSAEP